MKTCAIVGINWGDEGKGRMVDLLTRSLIFRLSGVTLTPFAATLSISPQRLFISSATPFPKILTTFGRKIPDGSRCSANFPYSLMTVCPAFPPP